MRSRLAASPSAIGILRLPPLALVTTTHSHEITATKNGGSSSPTLCPCLTFSMTFEVFMLISRGDKGSAPREPSRPTSVALRTDCP
jgi:hypothetical protein